jgi:hypothetical protein
LAGLGILFLIIAAKIKLILPFSPVPITLGTFAVLTIGTVYGQRLGLFTIFGYLLIGMLGFDVFANSSAESKWYIVYVWWNRWIFTRLLLCNYSSRLFCKTKLG